MKLKFWILTGTVVFILSFVSCSNSQGVHGASLSYDDTLRQRFQDEFSSVNWTEALEPEFLSRRKELDQALFADRNIETVEAATVLSFPPQYQVHPSIDGFGLVETGSLPLQARELLGDFCDQLVKVSGGNSVGDEVFAALYQRMASGKAYMLAVYLHDSHSYPPVKEFILGQASRSKEGLQVPVLFSGRQEHWTVFFYLTQGDGEWKVEQIRYGDVVYE